MNWTSERGILTTTSDIQKRQDELQEQKTAMSGTSERGLLGATGNKQKRHGELQEQQSDDVRK
jgi:hypothetical protein